MRGRALNLQKIGGEIMSDVEIAVLGLASAVLVFLAAVLTFLPALGDALRRHKRKRRK